MSPQCASPMRCLMSTAAYSIDRLLAFIDIGQA